jgi:Fe-S-cluster containining protein
MTSNDTCPNHDTATTECRRCGTCCKKGGPCFHLEDKGLIEKGLILSKYLYTIRKGELSFDNIKGSISPATTDIIKIKGRNGSWTCVFFDEKNTQCTIYDTRPLECRVLKCWDTRDIEKIYAKDRLTRKDLISGIEGLWDLVEAHQKQCGYDMLTLFVDALNTDKKDDALKGILDIIEHDIKIRELVVGKAGLESDLTDFLFGRPITETIKMYGLKIEKDGKRYLLVPTGGRSLRG